MDSTVTQPTRQAIAVRDRSAKGMVTGRLRRALIEMVWAGACRADAAKTAGMTDHSLRAALKKSHVKAFYLSELEVLRTSEKARNVFALVDVRDKSQNAMARVAAAKALDVLADDPIAHRQGEAQLPGLTIQIINESDSSRRDSNPVVDVDPEPSA